MHNKEIAIITIIVLTISLVFPFVNPNIKTSNPTLINIISSLVNNVNWDYADDHNLGWNSIMTQSVGAQFGITNINEISNRINSLTDPLEVLEAYSELEKLSGIILNQTKICWALDEITIMPNGLPKNIKESGQDGFSTHYRFALQGFKYAQEYNFDLAKWNVTNAYNHFHAAVFNSTYPGVLTVFGDDGTFRIRYGPRYYDEAGETIDCFLIFYQLGIKQALEDANKICDWINCNLWSGSNYNYALNWTGYECEASGFLQIIMKLQYYNTATSSTTIERLKTDFINRFLIDRWNSPQWTCNGKSYYAVVHMHNRNSQVRLQNTLGAWSALHGIYLDLPTDQKNNMRVMLKGNDTPAWRFLYDNSTLWTGTTFVGDNVTWANAQAAILLLLLGIVPGSGSIAIPVSEQFYEDNSNMIDPELYALDLEKSILTIPIMNPGTLTFIYGKNPISYDFQIKGVYNVTFSNDFNNIISANLISALPNNRLYINMTANSQSLLLPEIPDKSQTQNKTQTPSMSQISAATLERTVLMISVIVISSLLIILLSVLLWLNKRFSANQFSGD